MNKLSTFSIAIVLGLAVEPVSIALGSNGTETGMAIAGSDKSNKGGNSSKSSEKSASKGNSSRSSSPKKEKSNNRNVTRTTSLDSDEAAPLHPREKGRWNASNANQKALDAHIRNGNFNGTVGTLAQYQLAAKAANGDELNEYEQRALDEFITKTEPEVTDADIEDFLNDSENNEAPIFTSENGVVMCSDNCPEDEQELLALNESAQKLVDEEIAKRDTEFTQAQLDQFLQDSEDRITYSSNKTLTPERNDNLLDEIADDLGVVRADLSENLGEVGESIGEFGEDVSTSLSKAGKDLTKSFKGLFK
ncbi:hypothetical protein OU789_06310 [Halocynthiibacter sp. C4]|uniref:hypothetical protein n=1 Tax=Halocynthiibacter sp. C4 TaxID=2992758 RepID=UPI00237AAD5A|nr:hypothetical protein [Halocynthiibacter sp. C4]MDE0589531.1 hypothetical protein [Halocynthiibacter sp. C4]